MNINTEALQFMFEDQIDARKGSNLKMNFKRAFQMPILRLNAKSILNINLLNIL